MYTVRDQEWAINLIGNTVLDGADKYERHTSRMVYGRYISYEIPVDNTPEEVCIKLYILLLEKIV